MEYILVCNSCLEANSPGAVEVSKTIINCNHCNVPMKEVGHIWQMEERATDVIED